MSDQPTMSDLYRIDREAISEWESDVLAGAAAAGALVPVEPVGTLTVGKGLALAMSTLSLPPGTYDIVSRGEGSITDTHPAGRCMLLGADDE